MTCYHPLKAFIVGINPDTGKDKLKITSYEIDHIIEDSKGNFHYSKYSICPYKKNCNRKVCNYDCEEFSTWFKSYQGDCYVKHHTIPCGQCIGCRIQNSREWANRMILELMNSDNAYFVTLTYDNENVPHGCDSETGEVFDNLSLCKRDLQLFNKKLRKKFGDGIRFFACGEYGDTTLRPHYHIIYFNLKLNELDKYNVSTGRKGQYKLWRSHELESIWKKGAVIVGEVNWSTCAYVSRYVTKKQKGYKKKDFEKLGIEPIFATMSRRPGIGAYYFWDNEEEIYSTYIIRAVNDGKLYEFCPPKYFDYLFEKYQVGDITKLEEFKEMKRKKVKNEMDLALSITDKQYLEYLEVLEYNFEHRIKSLVRSDL